MKFNGKISIIQIFDLATFLFALLGFILVFTDLRFMGDYPRLATIPYLMTFTGLSNVFIGLASLLCFIVRFIYKEETLPRYAFILKLLAVMDITITFLITACYLAPNLGDIWWRLYINASLFNHLLTPITAIVGYIFFERYVKLDWKYCFTSFVPMGLYAILYMSNVIIHKKDDGTFDLYYDIYGFARFGIGIFILFLFAFLAFSFLLTFLYYLVNNHKKKN